MALLHHYARSQEPAAFVELSRRYAGVVYGTCLRITANVHDAEELTQDCFFELARRAATIRSSVGGWLHSLATHRRAECRPVAQPKARARTRRRGDQGTGQLGGGSRLAPSRTAAWTMRLTLCRKSCERRLSFTSWKTARKARSLCGSACISRRYRGVFKRHWRHCVPACAIPAL